MARSISKRNILKVSIAKPSFKPLPEDKSLGLDSSIRLYELEDGDKTEEGEDAEILIVQDKSLAATKQKYRQEKFPYIDTFDHQ